MIVGTGIDIQEIKQIKDIYIRKEEKVLRKVFTDAEIQYCEKHKEPFKHYAARWAIKEAYVKAMGTGIAKGHTLKDIETINLASGKPEVKLYGKIKKECDRLGVVSFVSLSHSGDYAVGQVILYKV
jgi:holo-[acyl-carrier protein] synthase